MFHEPNEQLLFLSKDKKYLLDEEDNIILEMMGSGAHTYYKTIGVESAAYEKICTDIKTRRVCILWNNKHECQLWHKVEVCTQYELVSKGFSNIS